MADNIQFYTEGGMPSNRQVCGVRVSRVYTTDQYPLLAGDEYKLFDLDANEIVLAIGVDVLGVATDTGAVNLTIHDDNGALASLTAVDLKATGKTAGTVSQLAGGGVGVPNTVAGILTGVTDGVDFNVYAVVANVDTPETFTKVDTPAP